MSIPKVSVCIPVYNGEKCIEKAIKSVLDQSFTDFELLIVDNASLDKTEEIVKSISDNRIRFLKNSKNIGMVQNWNCCINNCQGEYIHFLCADDYLAKNCLEKKVKAFNIDEEISIIFNSTYIVNDCDKVIMKRRPFHRDRIFEGKAIGHKSFIHKNIYGEPSNVMFKRKISEKLGCFDSRLCYAPDWDFWIKISMTGKVYYIDDFLTYYRVSNTSETSNLLKTKEILMLDDAQFIRNCIENDLMKLSKIDIIIHKFNIKLRMYARDIFYKFNSFR